MTISLQCMNVFIFFSMCFFFGMRRGGRILQVSSPIINREYAGVVYFFLARVSAKHVSHVGESCMYTHNNNKKRMLMLIFVVNCEKRSKLFLGGCMIQCCFDLRAVIGTHLSLPILINPNPLLTRRNCCPF